MAGNVRQLRAGREFVRRLRNPGGRPVTAWTAELRRTVEEHPVQSLAIAIAVGFVAGKLLLRRR
jgi:ElaB/YqjD/DUF883 family membrane-anchored ribosome-binding protein